LKHCDITCQVYTAQPISQFSILNYQFNK